MKTLNDHGLESLILNDDGLRLVAFLYPDGASLPCRHFKPEFLAFEKHSRIPCYVIDALENPSAADSLKVSAVPTTILLKDGAVIMAVEGPYSRDGLARKIEEALKEA